MYDVSSDLGSRGSVSLSMDAPLGNGSGSFVPFRAMSISDSDPESIFAAGFATNLNVDLDSSSGIAVSNDFESSLSFANPPPLELIDGGSDLSVDGDSFVGLSSASVDLGGDVVSGDALNLESLAAFDFDSIAASVIDTDTGWLNNSSNIGLGLELGDSLDLVANYSSPVEASDASVLLDANLDSSLFSDSIPGLTSTGLFSSDLAGVNVDDLNTHSFGSMSVEIGIADQSVNSSANASLDVINHISLDNIASLSLESTTDSDSIVL